MTGRIAEFFADLREVRKEERERKARKRTRQAQSDPLVDLRALPEAVLEPIQPQVDAWLNAPRSECRVGGFLGVQLIIQREPRGPSVPRSELLDAFAKAVEMSAASERALRQRAGEIEAETGLRVVEGRADNLKARLMRATEAQTAAELRLDTARTEIAALQRQAAVLMDGMRSAEQRIRDFAHERDELASQLQQTKADRDDRLQKMLAYGKRIVATAKQVMSEKAALDEQITSLRAEIAALKTQNAALAHDKQVYQQEVQRLTKARDERAGLEAEIVARANKMLADNEARDTEVQTLRADQQRLRDENRRWQAHSHDISQAAARFKRECDALREQVAALKADKQILDDVNWWLQEKLRLRGEAPRAA